MVTYDSFTLNQAAQAIFELVGRNEREFLYQKTSLFLPPDEADLSINAWPSTFEESLLDRYDDEVDSDLASRHESAGRAAEVALLAITREVRYAGQGLEHLAKDRRYVEDANVTAIFNAIGSELKTE